MSQETWNLALTLPLISSEALGNDFFSLSINFLIYIVKNELYPLLDADTCLIPEDPKKEGGKLYSFIHSVSHFLNHILISFFTHSNM